MTPDVTYTGVRELINNSKFNETKKLIMSVNLQTSTNACTNSHNPPQVQTSTSKRFYYR